MGKFIKVFYNISDDGIDMDCLNKCPLDPEQTCMCGSIICQEECKYCFGGSVPRGEHVIFLNDHINQKHRFVLEQGWIYCGKFYNNKKDWRFRRILYVMRLKAYKMFRKVLIFCKLKSKWDY
jgi:hypothetical protein